MDRSIREAHQDWTGRSLLIQHSLVIHPVCGLIVWIYGVLVTDLFGPVSLLVHVGPPNQLGTKIPALAPRQLDIHSYIVIGFLKNIKLEERAGAYLCLFAVRRVRRHLQVTLVSVEYDRLLPVEFSLHFQGQPADGGLEVRLLGVNHQSDSMLHGVLDNRRKSRQLTRVSAVNIQTDGLDAYVGQNVQSLQHPLHLALLFFCELLQQRLQLTRLSANTNISSSSVCFLRQNKSISVSVWLNTKIKSSRRSWTCGRPWVNMHRIPRSSPAKCWLALQHWQLIQTSRDSSLWRHWQGGVANTVWLLETPLEMCDQSLESGTFCFSGGFCQFPRHRTLKPVCRFLQWFMTHLEVWHHEQLGDFCWVTY